MTKRVVARTSFDRLAIPDLDEVTGFLSGSGIFAWDGTCAELVSGYEGVGQAVKGPISLRCGLPNSTYDTIYFKAHIKFLDPSYEQSVVDYRHGPSSNVFLGIDASGHWFVEKPSGTAERWTSTGPIVAINTWYVVEFAAVTKNSPNGRFEVRVGGVPVDDLVVSGVDITTVDFTASVQMNNADLVVDHCEIDADTVGTFDSSWFRGDSLGNPRMVTMLPKAQGNYSDWWVGDQDTDDAPGPATDHWLEVDDPVMDGSLSYLVYVHGSTAGTESLLFDDDDGLLDDANRIHSVAFATSITGVLSFKSIQRFLRIGGTDYAAATVSSQFSGWRTYVDFWTEDPSNPGDEFTVGQIDGLDAGVVVTGSGSGKRYVSAMYLIVSYATVPAPDPPLAVSGQFLLAHKSHRMTKIYKIEPIDAQDIFYLTEHPSALTYEGQSYVPTGSLEGGAYRDEVTLDANSLDVQGLVSDTSLSYDHLRAGRFQGAKVTVSIIDWLYPWQGAIDENTFWVANYDFDNDGYRMEFDGLVRLLRESVGNVYGRTCRHQLGDTKCGYQLVPVTKTNVDVDTVIDARLVFEADGFGLPAGPGDNYYALGKLTWTVGDNAEAGVVSEVKSYVEADRRIYLQLLTPFDITTSDQFTLVPGCNKIFATCRDVFSNADRFGGWRFLRGFKKLATK